MLNLNFNIIKNILIIYIGIILTTSEALSYMLKISNTTFFYPFLLVSFILLCFYPIKKTAKSIDKFFVIFFGLFLLINLVSIVLNYYDFVDRGFCYQYYLNNHSSFDSPKWSMFLYGFLRPTLLFIYTLFLFVFISAKNGVKILLKTLVIVAFVSCCYSIYQEFAFIYNLPFASIFSGKEGEIISFMGIRRVEGIFYEPGPQAAFLSPIFCILVSQLFEQKQNLLFNQFFIRISAFLCLLVLILTLSPIGYLTPLLFAIFYYILNFLNKDKIQISKKTLHFVFNSIIIGAVSVMIFSIFLLNGDYNLKELVDFMISKVQVSTNDIQSASTYLSSDSRSVGNYVGIKMFLDHFWFGGSPGSAVHLFYKYAPFAIAEPGFYLQGANTILNNHIKIMAETGIIGFIIYLCILLYPITLYIKNRKNFKSKLIDAILIAYLIFLILPMQSQPHFYQKYIWMLYVTLITLIKQYRNNIAIKTNYIKNKE